LEIPQVRRVTETILIRSVAEGIKALQRKDLPTLRHHGPDPTLVSSIVQNQLSQNNGDVLLIHPNPSYILLAIWILEVTVKFTKINCKRLCS